jgi:hypothetical protein
VTIKIDRMDEQVHGALEEKSPEELFSSSGLTRTPNQEDPQSPED